MFTLWTNELNDEELDLVRQDLAQSDSVRECADKSKIAVEYLGTVVEVDRARYENSISSARVHDDFYSRMDAAADDLRIELDGVQRALSYDMSSFAFFASATAGMRRGVFGVRSLSQIMEAPVELSDGHHVSVDSDGDLRVDCWSHDGGVFSILRRWTTDKEEERQAASEAWERRDTAAWSRYTAPIGLEVLDALGFSDAAALIRD